MEAYKGSSAKSCPTFVTGGGFDFANLTAYDTTLAGLYDLRCLELSDITPVNLAWKNDNDDSNYTLPFVNSGSFTDFFNANGKLLQDSARTYYDDELVIGNDYFKNGCWGTHYTPIWLCRKLNDDDEYDYWAFCVDPFQNATSGDNKKWSTFNYRIVD
jgi:hypothetical protein